MERDHEENESVQAGSGDEAKEDKLYNEKIDGLTIVPQKLSTLKFIGLLQIKQVAE